MQNGNKYDYVIVGAGLYGATFAREMAEQGKKVLVIDKRSTVAGNVYTGIEGLVAHRHAVAEGLPVKVFDGMFPTMAQEASVFVHDIRVAIDHPRHVAIARRHGHGSHPLQGVGRRQSVAGIEEAHIFARDPRQSLVHGIVDTLVGFGHDGHAVSVLHFVGVLLVCLRQG